MGDPRKQRRKFKRPGHPWQKERIEEETELKKEYGFKNKKEIWKMNSLMRTFASQAKSLVTRKGEQADKERALLLSRLQNLGLLGQEATLDVVLGLSIRELSERRLQTQVHKKMLANSAKQARQFITHGHITINGKKITSPSYLVSVGEEAAISFHEASNLANPEHPERAATRKVKEQEAKESIVEEEKPKKKAEKEASTKETKEETKTEAPAESKEEKAESVEEKEKAEDPKKKVTEESAEPAKTEEVKAEV